MTAQAGAAGLTLVMALAVALVVAASTLVAVVDLAAASAAARAAADAAALAGAGTSPLVAPGGATPTRAAARIAAANGARLAGSDDSGWPLRFAVRVEVMPRTAWLRRITGPVGASATAGVRPPRTAPPQPERGIPGG